VFKAIAAGKAACSVMAAALDCQVALWDVGVDAEVADVTATNPDTLVVHYKVKPGFLHLAILMLYHCGMRLVVTARTMTLVIPPHATDLMVDWA
jgi:hypothetical protein